MKIENISLSNGEESWLISFKNTKTGLEERFLRKKKELSTLGDNSTIFDFSRRSDSVSKQFVNILSMRAVPIVSSASVGSRGTGDPPIITVPAV